MQLEKDSRQQRARPSITLAEMTEKAEGRRRTGEELDQRAILEETPPCRYSVLIWHSGVETAWKSVFIVERGWALQGRQRTAGSGAAAAAAAWCHFLSISTAIPAVVDARTEELAIRVAIRRSNCVSLTSALLPPGPSLN
ncbi:hypothetical protein MGYG_00871 [Nannizzia gypsea CBS 118893]|uniref:Uncharacterized protein n=1 Tax=Arthroderma gypseum (strain ATCC MYA-4604 / CBS 118893) TaxID=535722 RepID=E5R2F9_ARTGP|nr:hypothetical protein MGYG_00871 [Nannizzia gypsea CBS 118893]EFQ97835.1 hypothetical protein MGYG_00871 [Nannizzia gypsea CBS 118893]